MVKYLHVAQEFHEVVTDKVNGLSIVFLSQLIFTIVILIISINVVIDITLTNILYGIGLSIVEMKYTVLQLNNIMCRHKTSIMNIDIGSF